MIPFHVIMFKGKVGAGAVQIKMNLSVDSKKI
jgi:hypothetical protein